MEKKDGLYLFTLWIPRGIQFYVGLGSSNKVICFLFFACIPKVVLNCLFCSEFFWIKINCSIVSPEFTVWNYYYYSFYFFLFFSFFFFFFFFYSWLVFSHKFELIVFHWSPSDNKSPQVSRILLGILTDHNNTVVCIVLILPLIISSPSFFSRYLVTFPGAPNTIVTFMFHRFFSS